MRVNRVKGCACSLTRAGRHSSTSGCALCRWRSQGTRKVASEVQAAGGAAPEGTSCLPWWSPGVTRLFMCVAVLPMPCTCLMPARLRDAAAGRQGAHGLGHTDVSRVGPGGVVGACQSEVLGRRAGSSEELEQEERRELMV